MQKIEEKCQSYKENINKYQLLDYYIYELIYNKLGFKHKLKGSMYLAFYIKYAIENNLEMYNCSLSKKIYPTIAIHFKTTPEKVERAIRNVIDITWKDINDDIKKQLFLPVKDSKPTNMEIIYALYNNINSYFNKDENINDNQTLDNYIDDLIYNKLGFKYKLKGSIYLTFYIKYAIENNLEIYNCRPTKEIYPDIANHFQTTLEKVERAIRGAIDTTLETMNDDIKKHIFGNNNYEKVTNMEVIYAIYSYINRNYAFNKDENDKVLTNYIDNLIYNKLGFKYKLKGSTYLAFYIKYVIENNLEVYNCSPTKEIYPAIANYFKTTPEKVERAIRGAIDTTWETMDDNTKTYFFPIVGNNRPTNTEVIYAIYDYIKYNNYLCQNDNEEKQVKKNIQDSYKYYLRFEIQKMLEESFHIYSHFGITKLQILVDVIMIVIEMGGVTDTEMKYIISKISTRYGLDFGSFQLFDGYMEVDTITPILYKMCKQIYEKNKVDFPEPKDKTFIKSYLNILACKAKNRYYN